jgi:hypothetical protein
MRAARGWRLERHPLTLFLDRSLVRLPLALSGLIATAFLSDVRRHEKLRARDAAAPHECHDEKEREARVVNGSKHANFRIANNPALSGRYKMGRKLRRPSDLGGAGGHSGHERSTLKRSRSSQ